MVHDLAFEEAIVTAITSQSCSVQPCGEGDKNITFSYLKKHADFHVSFLRIIAKVFDFEI